MNGTRVSDFSIERTLSPQPGRTQPEPAPDGSRKVPGEFSLEAAGSRAPGQVPVVPVLRMYFGDGFCSCSVAFQQADISFGPNPPDGSDAAQSGTRLKVRMRTVVHSWRRCSGSPARRDRPGESGSEVIDTEPDSVLVAFKGLTNISKLFDFLNQSMMDRTARYRLVLFSVFELLWSHLGYLASHDRNMEMVDLSSVVESRTGPLT